MESKEKTPIPQADDSTTADSPEMNPQGAEEATSDPAMKDAEAATAGPEPEVKEETPEATTEAPEPEEKEESPQQPEEAEPTPEQAEETPEPKAAEPGSSVKEETPEATTEAPEPEKAVSEAEEETSPQFEAEVPVSDTATEPEPEPEASTIPTSPEAQNEKPDPAKPEAGKEEEEEDLEEKYAAFKREELLVLLETLVQADDVSHIRRHIGYIKAAYRKLLKEENVLTYESRMGKVSGPDEEGAGETPEPPDPLNERFEQALAVYKGKKAVYDQAYEQQKQENLKQKEKILENLRSLIESEEELKKTYDQFRDLQELWRNTGPVPQGSKSTLWNNYHFLVEKFFDKVKINKELKDLDLKKNLEAKAALCEKAEELLLDSSITRSFQKLQKLHEAWKETGPVQKDKKDEIWERFKAATDKLNKRRQEYYESVREEQNKNHAAKTLLCEKAEQLSEVMPASPRQWQQYTDQMNELFSMWKTIGFAPKKLNNEVWNRFRAALDAFYKNKKEFFRQYKDQQTENYNQKVNLCLQAEAMQNSEDWHKTTEDLINLQKEWKKIGPVPPKFSDKIWKRFRAACDVFFNNKAAHFANIGDRQEENLKRKMDLIERVNSHAYGTDNTENLEVLKGFQREWMELGHVPIKQKDKVQAAFRKAIDKQFEVLNISKKAKTTLSFQTRIDNIRSSPHAGNIIYKERNYLSGRIHALESDIKLWENNMGFFASSRKADILKAEIEGKIEKARQEIAVMEEKLRMLREAE